MASAVGRVVLVVEDNLLTTDGLRQILIMLNGYRVVAANDGLDALEMLERGLRPAVIVLDLAMPKMDGRALHAALLANPEMVDIPVVVYSGGSGQHRIPGIVAHDRTGTGKLKVL